MHVGCFPLWKRINCWQTRCTLLSCGERNSSRCIDAVYLETKWILLFDVEGNLDFKSVVFECSLLVHYNVPCVLTNKVSNSKFRQGLYSQNMTLFFSLRLTLWNIRVGVCNYTQTLNSLAERKLPSILVCGTSYKSGWPWITRRYWLSTEIKLLFVKAFVCVMAKISSVWNKLSHRWNLSVNTVIYCTILSRCHNHTD